MVQSLHCYCVRKVSGYVYWLPGNKPDEEQTKQFFSNPCLLNGVSNQLSILLMLWHWLKFYDTFANKSKLRILSKFWKWQKIAPCVETKCLSLRHSSELSAPNQEDIDPHDPTKPSSLKTPSTRGIEDHLHGSLSIHDHPHTWGACHPNHYISEFNQK